MDFEVFVLIWLRIFFDGRYKIQDYFRYSLHLFSVSSFIFSEKRKTKGANPFLPSKGSLNYSSSLFKG